MDIRKRQMKANGQNLLPVYDNLENNKSGRFRGDGKNIILLFLLYTLQGIPLGLSAAIPMILQNRGVSYKQQAEFNFVNWPFSLKLIWAPIVDSLFFSRLGRRKTWLIPTQYFLGLTMLILSKTVDQWLGSSEIEPNIAALTAAFFFLNFLAATQDIAVDGWALTMLKKCNVSYASTCNSTGQTTGFFCGYVLFLTLESAEFCNNYLRSEPGTEGIITFSGFLFFWGIVFLVTTTFVAVFKSEKQNVENDEEIIDMNPVEAYLTLWKIAKMPPIRTLIAILLTVKIGFSATDAVSSLKLIEAGLPKEKLGFLAVPLIPFQIILVFVISKWTSGPRPMDLYLKVIPYRLVFSFVVAGLVWLTPKTVIDGHIPFYYSIIILITYAVHQWLQNCMFVAIMAFFAKISDPTVGGTYMTLLNTLSNFGGNWPATVALWFVDNLTWSECQNATNSELYSCNTSPLRKKCIDTGGICNTYMDGFYVETVICVIIGFIWLLWGKRKILYLQSLNELQWKVIKNKQNLKR